MDVILDVLDTLVFDRLYAAVLPRHSATKIAHYFPSNSTELATLNESVNRYFALSPSKWATQSILPRDHLLRQSLSLFLITWLGLIAALLSDGPGLIMWLFFWQVIWHHSLLPQRHPFVSLHLRQARHEASKIPT